ncbi:hypothetical protein C366_03115 [Cryptococcus neoformans Tu401-1]|nr:hypothetical protein C365_03269 [Cryptococcus neoformans var. grubii Bt85]OXG19002.1 hypothetical protein C366_03115 [Cryptococcus neoformans var. grubii Tu401-1]OXM79584.1 hypothetical protein C364_03083 [Cryptococcus neoformans var. grubii Bt63]
MTHFDIKSYRTWFRRRNAYTNASEANVERPQQAEEENQDMDPPGEGALSSMEPVEWTESQARQRPLISQQIEFHIDSFRNATMHEERLTALANLAISGQIASALRPQYAEEARSFLWCQARFRNSVRSFHQRSRLTDPSTTPNLLPSDMRTDSRYEDEILQSWWSQKLVLDRDPCRINQARLWSELQSKVDGHYWSSNDADLDQTLDSILGQPWASEFPENLTHVNKAISSSTF